MLRRSWLVVCCLTSTVAFAESYRFDMGGPATPVTAGYTQVTAKDLWAEGKEFGWVTAPAMVVNRNEATNPWFAQPDSFEYTLLSDGLLTVGENTFVFKVKPERYAVTGMTGQLAVGELDGFGPVDRLDGLGGFGDCFENLGNGRGCRVPHFFNCLGRLVPQPAVRSGEHADQYGDVLLGLEVADTLARTTRHLAVPPLRPGAPVGPHSLCPR